MNALLTNPKRLGRVFSADATNVTRDPTLLFALVLAFVPTLIFGVWREGIDAAALNAWGVADIVGWAMPVILSLPAFLIGWVTGFLFLEDRDDATLLAIDITPVGKKGFIAYRMSVTATLAFVLTYANCMIFIAEKGPLVGAVISAMVAMNAVVAAMILPVAARNKVEGLAITKVTNIGAIVPLLALVPSPLRYFGGLIPSYWVGEMLQLSPALYLPLWVIGLIGLTINAVLVVLVYNLLDRRVG